MRRKKKQLSLKLSREAELDLIEIHQWSRDQFGKRIADNYLNFLEEQTRQIAWSFPNRTRSLTPLGMRWTMIKKNKSRQSAGHIVVLKVVGDTLVVVRYFHTSQDWESRLAND